LNYLPSLNSILIRPSRGLFHFDWKAHWQYKELLYFLVWRDIKVRYKQTLIGAGWITLQPLMTVAIFALIFGRLAKIPSDGVPYIIFAFTALLPWNYFTQALTRSGNSLVNSANLISKIYFPRLLLPLSSALAPLIDFIILLLILLVMMFWFRMAPTWHVVTLPLFIFLAFLTAFTFSLWLSALNVRYRDVSNAIPFLIQFWMFASPVVYPVSMVPEHWKMVYSLNPMVGVIEGFRWALLGTSYPNVKVIVISYTMILILLFGGLVYFRYMERSFADIV
jgi:lipopolysaccharide transport system permease protein